MSERTHKKNTFGIIIAIIIAVIIVAIFFLLNNNRTVITEKDLDLPDYETLICTRSHQENGSLLSTKNAISAKITAKSIFKNGEFSEIAMSYYGEYNSDTEAIKAEAEIHSAYNIYTGKNLSKFTTAYNIVKNTVLANFYTTAAQETYIREYHELFLLNPEQNLAEMDIKKLKNNYEGQGFTCAIE